MMTSLTRARGGARSFFSLLARFRLRDRRLARKAAFDLSRLNDHALRDIGISRFELPHDVGHPLLWRWPR